MEKPDRPPPPLPSTKPPLKPSIPAPSVPSPPKPSKHPPTIPSNPSSGHTSPRSLSPPPRRPAPTPPESRSPQRSPSPPSRHSPSTSPRASPPLSPSSSRPSNPPPPRPQSPSPMRPAPSPSTRTSSPPRPTTPPPSRKANSSPDQSPRSFSPPRPSIRPPPPPDKSKSASTLPSQCPKPDTSSLQTKPTPDPSPAAPSTEGPSEVSDVSVSPCPSTPTRAPGSQGEGEADAKEEDRKPLARVPDTPEEAALWIQCGWRSRVARKEYDARKKLRKRRVHRATVCKEVTTTEASYNESLKAVTDVALKQLQWNAETSKNPILTKDKITKVFCNIESIYELSSNILADLKEKTDNWTDDTTIGDLFVKFAPFLRLYIAYCNNYDSAQDFCRSFTSEPLWEKFWKQCQMIPDFHNMDLNSFLIMPVQRIPRYVLLLKEIRKYTDEGHPDVEFLDKALSDVEEIATQVNKCMKGADAANKMLDLQRMFGATINFLEAHRTFISEGRLTLVTTKEEPVMLFLCNDYLVFGSEIPRHAKHHLELRTSMKLHKHSTVMSLPDLRTKKNGFRVTSPPHTVNLLAESKESRMLWLDRIQGCIDALEDKKDDDDVTEYTTASVLGTETRIDQKHHHFTVYVIELVRGNLRGKIFKRYSEINDLDARLRKDFPDKACDLPPLSKKELFSSMKSKTIENRQMSIQAFIQNLILHPFLANLRLVSDFLEYKWALDYEASIMMMEKKEIVTIALSDGTFRKIPAVPSTRVSQLIKVVLRKCGLEQGDGNFAVYQCHGGNVRMMDGDEPVLRSLKENTASSLLCRKQLFLASDPIETDLSMRHLVFIQVATDWMEGFYPLTKDGVPKLAALKLQAAVGNYIDDIGTVERHVPLAMKKKKRVVQATAEEWKRVKGTIDSREAELKFIQKLQSCPVYGCSMFDAATHHRKSVNKFPSSVVLGVNETGVLVLDRSSKDIVADGRLPYSAVEHFACYPNSIEFTMKDGSGPHVFKMDHTHELSTTVQLYKAALEETEMRKQRMSEVEAGADAS
eukprot:Rmarinus@m.17971